MKASELLRKGADEIRRRGWWQGAYGSDHEDLKSCSVCAVGALNAADSGTPYPADDLSDAHYAASRLLDELVWRDGAGSPGIVNYNDQPGRTVEEVLDLFERAAVAAEENDD